MFSYSCGPEGMAVGSGTWPLMGPASPHGLGIGLGQAQRGALAVLRLPAPQPSVRPSKPSSRKPKMIRCRVTRSDIGYLAGVAVGYSSIGMTLFRSNERTVIWFGPSTQATQ